MKKRFSIAKIWMAAIVCTPLILSSCAESFLEPDPTFYEPELTLNSEAGIEAVMARADRSLRALWISNENRNISVPIGTEFMFSEMSVASKTDDANLFTDIANRMTPQGGIGYDAGDWTPFFWDESYNGIKQANTITTYIENVQGMTEETKNMHIGRAYFHRSFRYLSLVFQFGDVPLVTKIIKEPKLNYKSTKKEEILKMITQDMEFAVQWVPDQAKTKYVGMVNKGACRMLLIKCYLATGQFQKAKEQADILIDQSGYSLMQDSFGTFVPNYSTETWPITRNVIWDLHRPENKLIGANKEVIMGMVNTGATAQSMREFLSMRIFGPSYTSGSDLKTPDGKQAVVNYARNHKDYRPTFDYIRGIGRGIATWRLTPYASHGVWKVNSVDDKGDLRHNSEVGNWGKMENIKYNNPESEWFGENVMMKHPDTGELLCTDSLRVWFDWPHYKIYLHDVLSEANQGANQFNGASNGGNANWYLYRLAEAYLLRAEAKFYLGDVAGATSDVNKVRERAKCEQMYTTVTIGDIMDERARELYLEEMRNVELKRVSYCLALSGKADEWGNTYDVNTFDKQAGTDKVGGSYWYQRVIKYGMYNQGERSVRPNTFNYQMGKQNHYWPIPNSAITANNKGRLHQNFGYDGYDASIPMWDKWEDAVADESVY